MPTPIPPARVVAELGRLGLNEWAFIRECSRAEECNVNVCPLDPLIAFRGMDPLDRETRCPAYKPTRERYFSRMKPEMQALLPFGGLLEAEWNRRDAGRRRQAALTPEQRAKQIAKLAVLRARALQFGAATSSAQESTGAGAPPNRPSPG